MSAKYDRIKKIRFEGAVDADGHILEAADLWENYLEAKYKPLALRIKRAPGGTQYLEIGGRPSKITRGSVFAKMCSMGTPRDKGSEVEHLCYGEDPPLGALDAHDSRDPA